MQYDRNKVVPPSTIRLTWHGEDTRVALVRNGDKIEVKQGETIEVTEERAKFLLSYSDFWTLEGDEPILQPYVKAQRDALLAEDARMRRLNAKREQKKAKAAAPAPVDSEATGEPAAKAEPTILTLEEVDAFEDVEVVVKHLTDRDAKFNRAATVDELKALLREFVEAEIAQSVEDVKKEKGEGDEKKEATDAPKKRTTKKADKAE